MPKRLSKNPTDSNVLGFQIVQAATGQQSPKPVAKSHKKNPAAVALGRLGGLKGGKARAAKLSASQRRQIAKKAAKTRWHR